MFRNILGFCFLGALIALAYFGYELSRVETVMQQISARIAVVGSALIAVCCIGFSAIIPPGNDP